MLNFKWFVPWLQYSRNKWHGYEQQSAQIKDIRIFFDNYVYINLWISTSLAHFPESTSTAISNQNENITLALQRSDYTKIVVRATSYQPCLKGIQFDIYIFYQNLFCHALQTMNEIQSHSFIQHSSNSNPVYTLYKQICPSFEP